MQTYRRAIRESAAGQAILSRRRQAEAAAWEAAGKQDRTPYWVKVNTIADYAARYGTRVFVETGTYQGEMIAAQEARFDRLLSVELDPNLHAAATRRFRRRPKVELYQGDSATRLPEMLATANEPALFWLDAHYSRNLIATAKGEVETPISAELGIILERPFADVVLIDDADEFDGTNDYPPLDALLIELRDHHPDRDVTCDDAIIRITRR